LYLYGRGGMNAGFEDISVLYEMMENTMVTIKIDFLGI
jgi:hypothetical protein